jgi:hypothetical protein
MNGYLIKVAIFYLYQNCLKMNIVEKSLKNMGILEQVKEQEAINEILGGIIDKYSKYSNYFKDKFIAKQTPNQADDDFYKDFAPDLNDTSTDKYTPMVKKLLDKLLQDNYGDYKEKNKKMLETDYDGATNLKEANQCILDRIFKSYGVDNIKDLEKIPSAMSAWKRDIETLNGKYIGYHKLFKEYPDEVNKLSDMAKSIAFKPKNVNDKNNKNNSYNIEKFFIDYCEDLKNIVNQYKHNSNNQNNSEADSILNDIQNMVNNYKNTDILTNRYALINGFKFTHGTNAGITLYYKPMNNQYNTTFRQILDMVNNNNNNVFNTKNIKSNVSVSNGNTLKFSNR